MLNIDFKLHLKNLPGNAGKSATAAFFAVAEDFDEEAVEGRFDTWIIILVLG